MILKKNNKVSLLSSHLIELRNRFLYFFLFFITSFLFSYLFVEDIFNFISEPFVNSIEFKNDKRLIYTGLAEAFLSYLKLALISGFIISSPFFIYQLWAFIAPGLLNKERKIIFPFLFLVPIMFILGFLFVYYLIIPLAWDFFTGFDKITENQLIVEAKKIKNVKYSKAYVFSDYYHRGFESPPDKIKISIIKNVVKIIDTLFSMITKLKSFIKN